MSNDHEKVKAMLTELGVGFEERDSDLKPGGGKQIRCAQGMPKVGGYTFFYVTFDFYESGNFMELGAWE